MDPKPKFLVTKLCASEVYGHDFNKHALLCFSLVLDGLGDRAMTHPLSPFSDSPEGCWAEWETPGYSELQSACKGAGLRKGPQKC